MAGRRVRIDRIAHVILNLRLQYSPSSGRIPREDPFLSLFRVVPPDSCFTSDATIATAGKRSLLRAEIFCQFRCRCKFQFTSVNICWLAPKKDFDVPAFYPPSNARLTSAREKLYVSAKNKDGEIPDEWERNRSFHPLEITIEKKETEIHGPPWTQARFCLRYYFNGTKRFRLTPRVLHRFPVCRGK